MVRKENLCLSIPTFFRCPISHDLMKSPVSLSTGVTYDRSSIQTWLDQGNDTCPATMQLLQSKDLVPNHTLHRLIQIWSSHSSNSNADSDPPPLTLPHATQLLNQIKKDPDPTPLLSRLCDLLHHSDFNREVLIQSGCVGILVDLISGEKMGVLEAGVKLLRLVLCSKSIEEEEGRRLMDDAFLSGMLRVLRKGNLDSRVEAAKVLESVSGGRDSKSKILIAEKEGFLSELLRLVDCEDDSVDSDARKDAPDAGLSCLNSLAAAKPVRSQIVRLGTVALLSRLLLQTPSDSVSLLEKAAKLLETLSTCREGRAAIAADPNCVPAMVGKILKVSDATTERCVVALWSVCHVFRNRAAQEKVAEANGLARILLLMQSNCSAPIRQMAGDLLKIFRGGGSVKKSCLPSYDTQTKHIMPF